MKPNDDDLQVLFKSQSSQEDRVKRKLFLVGALLTPITLIGALWGYRRAYWRKLKDENQPPTINPIHPFAKKAMYIFAGVAWAITLVTAVTLLIALTSLYESTGPGFFAYLILFYLIPNSIISFFALGDFNRWRSKMYAMRTDDNMFGSAKWAEKKDLLEYEGGTGLYIGAGYTYNKMGHLISVAGTRSGKATNLIFPNLLGASDYDGSWLVIDPKGEGAYVTARYQREIGNNVQVLDPWRIVDGEAATFNPLDIIQPNDLESLIDDATMMAGMIVPENTSSKEPYWDERARSIISAMIVYSVIKDKTKTYTLTDLWRWLRLPDDKFDDLLYDMGKSENEFVRLTSNELANLKTNAPEPYGSVISTAQSHTDFLKSISLQTSIAKSSFDVKDLSKKKTTLYVVIPPDRLASQGKWLRLVVSSALRAVIRNRGHRVTFILDEFAAIGNLGADINSFMAIGAGYNITLWPIFQTIPQLQEIYDKSWQTFLGNTAVKHFWGVGDNLSANYISDLIGGSTYTVYDKNIISEDKGEPKHRMLATPDEVRRGSESNIFAFIDQKPAAMIPKWDYRDMEKLNERHDPNPYYANIGASK